MKKAPTPKKENTIMVGLAVNWAKDGTLNKLRNINYGPKINFYLGKIFLQIEREFETHYKLINEAYKKYCVLENEKVKIENGEALVLGNTAEEKAENIKNFQKEIDLLQSDLIYLPEKMQVTESQLSGIEGIVPALFGVLSTFLFDIKGE